MEQQPWEYYYDRFEKRVARVPERAFGRDELLYEAAHDAYESTANEMTSSGWDEEEVLTVTRMFGQVVKDWLAHDGQDLGNLREDLRKHYDDWTT